MENDSLVRSLQELADERKERVFLIEEYPGATYTSRIPYGVLESQANSWEKKNYRQVIDPR